MQITPKADSVHRLAKERPADAYPVFFCVQNRIAALWSGGDAWKDAELVSRIQEWVYKGGVFLGVGEPSATEGYQDYFRMAQVLGIDEDTGGLPPVSRFPDNKRIPRPGCP